MFCCKFTEGKGFLSISLTLKMALQSICQIWFKTKAPVNGSKKISFSTLAHYFVRCLGVCLVEGWRKFLWIIVCRIFQNRSNIDHTLDWTSVLVENVWLQIIFNKFSAPYTSIMFFIKCNKYHCIVWPKTNTETFSSKWKFTKPVTVVKH